MRVFLGLEIPDAVSASLDAALVSRRRELPAARWLAAQSRHLTLVFLGRIEDSLLSELNDLVAPVFGAESPIELELADCGTFPVGRPARIVWVGLAPSDVLSRLRQALAEVCRSLGFDVNSKPYTPHVTLARCSRHWPRSACQAWADAFPEGVGAAIPHSTFIAERACLLESVQGAQGVTYEVVRSYPLAGHGEPRRAIETSG